MKKLTLSLINHEKNGDTQIRKYKTKDGNEISITVQHGKVVYIEYDWLEEKKSTKTHFNGFVFGKTTLSDLRTRFGNNGFTYTSTAFVESGNGLIAFNCYELINSTSNILVFVTKVILNPEINELNIGDHFKLYALILANQTYLDEIWGKEKIYDPAYKKISL